MTENQKLREALELCRAALDNPGLAATLRKYAIRTADEALATTEPAVNQQLTSMTQSQPVTLTDEYAGVIAWVGDKQCKRVLTEGAIKHEHTPGVAMRNTAHQCVQEVIIAALREKGGK